ncbi:MAG: Smr/MutS family protein [Desulfobacteraceae bacterium]
MIEENNGLVHIPIDGVLDLHTFNPKEVAAVVDEYLGACLDKDIYEVRIIHGKGKGVLRRTVHALLENHPRVLEFKLDTGPSSWGATIVHLKKGGP